MSSDVGKYTNVELFNHEWDNPARLLTIGTLTKADTEAITEGRLSLDVPVQINSRIEDYDTLLVLGPVFPHEVVGFSGGNKYFFPGISVTHGKRIAEVGYHVRDYFTKQWDRFKGYPWGVLGFRDPATINVESFANRESEGVLLVRKAGEYLYRLKD